MPTLKNVRGLVMDMDGVLWRGDENLPGVAEFFVWLRAREIKFLLATNNATQTPDYYVERMRGIGVNIARANVLTSALATAHYLKQTNPRGARVYVVGEIGIVNALRDAGFEIVARDAQYVVVSLDRALTYEKLKRTTLEIRAGAKFIATNPDKTLPTAEGLIPGAGSILAALETAADHAPDVVIGKPSTTMFELALEMLALPRENVAMLGDRLDTDIAGAYAAGLQTILVLTGVSTRQGLADSKIKPAFVFANLDELRNAWSLEI